MEIGIYVTANIICDRLWITTHSPQTLNSRYVSSKINSHMQTSIACATYSVHNNGMLRTSAVQHEILVRILSFYC